MTEIRRPEATPQLATALYDAYRACKKTITTDGGLQVPVTFEDVFNTTLEARERYPDADHTTAAYLALCGWARLRGRGGIMRNAPEIGTGYVSTPVRYFMDDDGAHYETYLELKRGMEESLKRRLRRHERPLLMDRPVVLTMRAGEEANIVLSDLERTGEVMVQRLVGRGLAAALQPVHDDPHMGLSYHR